MSDGMFRNRKIRELKRETITAQKMQLKNKDRPEKKRGVKHGKK